jgi:RNA polymerase sigma-70 factor, ECF subfamily
VSIESAQAVTPGRSEPTEWVDRHGDALFRYALLRVRDRGAAEDLVQETLLAALRGADAFRQMSAERTWLIGILRHKVLDHFRRHARETALVDSFNELGDDDSGPFDGSFDERGQWSVEISTWETPERSLERAEFWRVFSDCVGRLPENLRTPFALRELEGLDSDALADVLQITRNNLWVTLSRARERVRRCLETHWFAGGRTEC